MIQRYKRLLIGSLFFLLFVFCLSPTVEAKNLEQKDTTASELAQQFNIKDRQFGPYKDSKSKPRYTDIDVATYDQYQKKENKTEGSWNPIKIVGNYFSEKADDMMGSVQDMIVSMFLMLVKAAFQFNIMMTEFLLTALHFSMNGDLMNYLISILGTKIQDTAGIHQNQIGTTGTFGTLASLFAIISVFYMVYVFSVKRAPLEGMKSLFQPIIALTLAILMITNFQTLTVWVNTLTSDLTNGIATATQKNQNGATKLDSLEDGVFKMMVHRPWLYLEFGTADEASIGSKRVESLLLNKPGEKKKENAIKEEIKKYDNQMLVPSSIITRMVYVNAFTVVNGFLSIPIWGLAFLFLGLQLYFILIACLAPFVLVMCVLPNQMGILWRYIGELVFPLGAKVVVSFIAMILFTISDIVYDIPMTAGLMGYFVSVYLQLVIFLILFLFRKRIMGLFSRGQGLVRHVIAGSKKAIDPAKEKLEAGVRGTTRLAGAAVGAYLGGPQGAMAGFQAGGQVGESVTGNRGLSELPPSGGSGLPESGEEGTGKPPQEKLAPLPPAKGEEEGPPNETEKESPSEDNNGENLPQGAHQDTASPPPDLHRLADLEGQNHSYIGGQQGAEGTVAPEKELHSLKELEEKSPIQAPQGALPPSDTGRQPDLVPLPPNPSETAPGDFIGASAGMEAREPARPLHSLEKKEADEEQKELEKFQRRKQAERSDGEGR
ncbi:CD3337/EF1877 family mobilome membrane protein [Listeria valentina]|uniref:CD3337/EF1877 family mobilome membrane protein n=1 Tax=Listeria valentina TaxID=2705293 RepID=UPI003CCE4F11